jgi:ligand-binding sensor domain-containing protein
MKQAYLFITALIVLLCCFSVPAQSPYFRKHSLPQEFNSAGVTVTLQDSRHFLWLGTTNGLFRFDGISYKRLLQDSLGPNNITSLFQDYEGLLWVGYKSGKIGIVKDDRFVQFYPEEGFPTVPVTGFAEDKDHALWFSTYGEGIYYFRDKRMYNINTDDGLTDNYAYTIAKDKQGKIWAATDGGITICSLENGKKKVVSLGAAEGLPDNIVTALALDPTGNMWIGTESMGICKYDAAQRKLTSPVKEWSYGAVTSIKPFGDNVWVGTHSGIVEVDPAAGATGFISKGNPALSGRISSIITDNEGNVWIANNTPVLHTTNRAFRFITSYEGKNIESIQAILRDRTGSLWYSTQHDVFRYTVNNKGEETFESWFGTNKPAGLNVISMCEDSYGYIWMGTFGQGVYRIDPQKRGVQHITESDGLVNDNVLSIASNGSEMWLATLGGVSRCVVVNGSKSFNFRNYTSESGLGSNYIYKVFIDSKKRTWFATDGKGITVLDHEKFTNYSSKNGLASSVIYSVAEDTKGDIWFSTSNAGVYRFDGKYFRRYTLRDGLRDLSVSSLIGDRNGNMLIVNRQAIDMLNTSTGSVFYHGQELGISEIDPNLNAYDVDGEGNIWLGTQKGIIKYCGHAATMQQWPATRINDILVFLDDVKKNDKHSFAYDENHISFDYIGFWYHDPEEVTYRIKLEGYDREWITSKNRFITYPNLPPGHYTFRLQSSATNNFNGAPTVIYSFVISPPFYNTVWFYVICALTVFALLYWYIKSRENKLRAAEALKKDKIEFQFETLKSQVNPHFLFNSFNTLIGVIEENKETAVEYVEKLSDFYRNILLQRERNVIPLREELQMIEDYYFLQKKRYKSNFVMSIDVQQEFRNFYIAPLTLQLLVENAVKHNVISREKPLTVEIFIQEDYIVVRNNLQRKQHAEPSTGVGLQNIIHRYGLLGDKQPQIKETAAYYSVAIPLLYTRS